MSSSAISDDLCAHPRPTPEVKKQTFYVVSIRKFLLLYFMTMGCYLIVWFFENWKQYRKATGVKVWPGVRALAGVIMVFSLFAKVQKALSESGRTYRWFPVTRGILIFTVWVVSVFFAFMPIDEFWAPWVIVISLLLMGVLGFLLVGAQRAINFLEHDPAAQSNSTLTFANGVWVGAGGFIWGVWLFAAYILFPDVF